MPLAYCLVVGTFAEIVPDDLDPDFDPQRVPLVGLKVEIRPDLAENFFTDGATSLLPKIFRATTNADGVLVPEKQTGSVGVPIIASNAPGQSPQAFTHSVSIATKQGKILSRFHIPAPAGGTVDLSDYIPVAPSPGHTLDDVEEVEARVIVLADQVDGAVLRIEQALADLEEVPNFLLIYENGLV